MCEFCQCFFRQQLYKSKTWGGIWSMVQGDRQMVGRQRMLCRTVKGGRYWEGAHTESESSFAKEIPSTTQILGTILSKARKTFFKLLQRMLGMEVEGGQGQPGGWGIAQLHRGRKGGLLGRDEHPQPWVHSRDTQGGNFRGTEVLQEQWLPHSSQCKCDPICTLGWWSLKCSHCLFHPILRNPHEVDINSILEMGKWTTRESDQFSWSRRPSRLWSSGSNLF